MLAALRSVLTWSVAHAVRPIVALRYRIDIRGLDAVRRRGRRSILFLPNHAALLDPAFLVAYLYPAFRLRPLADEHQVGRTAFGYLALLYGSRILPNLERSGAGARNRMRDAIRDIADGLRAGENILLYPAGHLKRHYLEEIGSASGTETLVKAVPEARIVLVRQNGLWGSSFSIGATGEMPSIGDAMARGVKDLLLNGLFFMPRRRVTIELVEPEDFPRTGTRAEINRYLEAFYNENAARNTYVPRGFWERGGPRELPDPVHASRTADASRVSRATRDLVFTHLQETSGVGVVTLQQRLPTDLGLDSLAIAEMVAWVQAEFGFSVDTPDSLDTVADVVLAAAGQGVSAIAVDLKPAPASWFASAGDSRILAVPPVETLTQAFLTQAAARAGQPIVADQTSGVRSYRDLVTAIYVLKPKLEQLPGQYVGIMMPASVGATIFFLAAMFAGKTVVMVNWTAGVRAMRHSLDTLGVTTVVTARALVTKLAATGLDIADVEDTFLFVEDILASVGTLEKLRAAAQSHLSWSALERVQPPEVAVVLFTSGSESMPKAVPLTHLNLLTDVRGVLMLGHVEEHDIVLGLLPPFHSFGLTTTVLLPLSVGMRAVYHPNPTESAVLAKLTAAYRASVLFCTPTFFGGMARVASDAQLATMQLVVTGAEKCPDALFATLHARWPSMIVLEGYGITECSPVVSCNRMDKQVPGTVGVLLPPVEGAIVDLDISHRMPPGETGMLLVRGPSIFGGYLLHTGESPFVQFEGKSWYRTGDLVSMADDGFITFRGRLKRFIKLGGEMISLPAIESVLVPQFGELDDGPVIAVEAIGTAEHPDIVLFTRKPAERAEVNAWIKDAGLSALHYVRQVVVVDAIPVLGTGKTDYRAIKARYAS
jgi:long-chain-fatty-acid--[acyl-carrier-protein] ligase